MHYVANKIYHYLIFYICFNSPVGVNLSTIAAMLRFLDVSEDKF